MPDDSIDIYIESSFFAVASGTTDVYSFFSTAAATNIGLRDTTAAYVTTTSSFGYITFPTDLYLTYSGAFQEGNKDTSTRYTAQASISGTEVCLVDYSHPITSSGLATTDDLELKYFTGTTKVSGSLTRRVRFTAGQLYDYSDNILGNYWTFASDDTEEDYEADYTAGGHYDPLIPGPPEDQVITSGTDDFPQYFTMGSGAPGGTLQQDCELFLAGYPMEFSPNKYTYRFHLATGLEGSKQAAEWEAAVISGAVWDIPIDVTSTVVASGYFNAEQACGLVDLVSYAFDSSVISGTIGYYFNESICSVSGTGGYSFDIDLFSLKISNFSLDVDGYTAASGMICVDVTDDVYGVSTSGTYFVIDETIVSGTFTPITDGYTMCYDSPTDFDNLVGATTVTVHATNNNSEILEQDFYLTSGYIVEYDNRDQDYGFGSQVVVRGEAENLVSCPRTGADAYYFTSVPKFGRDLGASIVGQPWGEKDLAASITPTTDTIYFYGKVFRIEVRAKDFAGNVMDPYIFEFKIEDMPE